MGSLGGQTRGWRDSSVLLSQPQGQPRLKDLFHEISETKGTCAAPGPETEDTGGMRACPSFLWDVGRGHEICREPGVVSPSRFLLLWECGKVTLGSQDPLQNARSTGSKASSLGKSGCAGEAYELLSVGPITTRRDFDLRRAFPVERHRPQKGKNCKNKK